MTTKTDAVNGLSGQDVGYLDAIKEIKDRPEWMPLAPLLPPENENPDEAAKQGYAAENTFVFWDGVGGRYSLWVGWIKRRGRSRVGKYH